MVCCRDFSDWIQGNLRSCPVLQYRECFIWSRNAIPHPQPIGAGCVGQTPESGWHSLRQQCSVFYQKSEAGLIFRALQQMSSVQPRLDSFSSKLLSRRKNDFTTPKVKIMTNRSIAKVRPESRCMYVMYVQPARLSVLLLLPSGMSVLNINYLLQQSTTRNWPGVADAERPFLSNRFPRCKRLFLSELMVTRTTRGILDRICTRIPQRSRSRFHIGKVSGSCKIGVLSLQKITHKVMNCLMSK